MVYQEHDNLPKATTNLLIRPARLVAELGKIVKSMFNFGTTSTII
jgi:hypothetical protein